MLPLLLLLQLPLPLRIQQYRFPSSLSSSYTFYQPAAPFHLVQKRTKCKTLLMPNSLGKETRPFPLSCERHSERRAYWRRRCLKLVSPRRGGVLLEKPISFAFGFRPAKKEKAFTKITSHRWNESVHLCPVLLLSLPLLLPLLCFLLLLFFLTTFLLFPSNLKR